MDSQTVNRCTDSETLLSSQLVDEPVNDTVRWYEHCVYGSLSCCRFEYRKGMIEDIARARVPTPHNCLLASRPLLLLFSSECCCLLLLLLQSAAPPAVH